MIVLGAMVGGNGRMPARFERSIEKGRQFNTSVANFEPRVYYSLSGLHLVMMNRASSHRHAATCHVGPRTRLKSFVSTTSLLTRRLDLVLCQTMQRGAMFKMLVKETEHDYTQLPLLTGIT